MRTNSKNSPALGSDRIPIAPTANGRKSQIFAECNLTLKIEVGQHPIELSEINPRLQLEIEQRQQAKKIPRQQRDLNLTEEMRS